jgi:hypothetical protein
LQLLETYGFPYRNRKNVIYSRNVMCNKNWKFPKNAPHPCGAEKNFPEKQLIK